MFLNVTRVMPSLLETIDLFRLQISSPNRLNITFCLAFHHLRSPETGLGQFGDADSATSRFGDGGRKCFMRKNGCF